MKNKKPRRSRLSIKIILTLFLVMLSVYAVISIIFSIARAAGLKLPENREEIDVWVRSVIYIFPLGLGVSIIALFSYALNKTIVARIRILKDATALVAKGNFDNTLEIKGCDELSELTESFNKMTAELKANEYLSKDFVRNISHEFKTPLSVIKAYGELIEAESDRKNIDRAALSEYSRIIMSEADRLSSLSKNILQLSLLDSTTIVKKEDTFSPAEQVRNILRNTQVLWSGKNIEFDLKLEETAVKSNEQLLYQVWQNLIGNAIKFSPQGGKISIALKTDGQGVDFKITDFGAGIKDEDKEKIFTQFFMTDKSRNTEGSGLGLAIVKKIIEKLGGEITFESKEGEGSIFSVTIPEE